MLERLVIRGFQRHRNLTVEFDPLVTVLVGKTNIGKSSVLRALRWLALNLPNGDGFISHGKTSCSVTLELDGHVIKRKRGRGINYYWLDASRYVAFGQATVPPDIAQLLNVGPATFQRQLDPPFWLTLPPGQVSKELNGVVSLEVIDRTLAHAASGARLTKYEVESTRARLAQVREQRDRLGFVPQLREEFTKITSMVNILEQKRVKTAQVGLLLKTIPKPVRGVDRGFTTLFCETGRVAKRLGIVRELVEQLEPLVRSAYRCRTGIEVLERRIRSDERELANFLRGRCPACGRK